MTPTPPPSLPAALPEPSGLYLRLWRAGFRWLYMLDAVGILAVTVLVTVVRFGTDWPEPGELLVGMVALTAILQLVFYFGGLYEKQARLGHRMWFARVVGLTLVGLAVGLVVVLPTGRYAVPRANLAAVGVGVVLVATTTRAMSRRLRSRRFGPPRVLLVGSSEQTALAASHLSETDRMAEVVAEVPVGAGVVTAADAHGATDVVFVDDVSLGDVMPEPLGALDGSGRGVYLRVTATTALLGLRDVREIGGMPYVAIRSRALHPHQLRLKRLVELGHDVVVLLDFNELSRCGRLGEAFARANSKKLVIDHHISVDEPWWDEAFVDVRASATGLLIHRIHEAIGLDIDLPAAEGIFTSIVSDTGWFKYSNTDAETLRIASELVEVGVEPARMFQAIEQRKNHSHPQLTGGALAGTTYFAEGRAALITQPWSEDAVGYDSDDVLDCAATGWDDGDCL